MSTTKQSYKTTQAQLSKLVSVQTGKVKLSVRGVSKEFVKINKKTNQPIDIKGYRGSVLVTFNAVDPRNNERLNERFENGELDEAEISDLLYTHEILITDTNPNPIIPCKGDTIEANIAFALTKEGEFYLDEADNKVMSITSYQIPVAKELKTLNLFSKATEEAPEGIPNTSEVTEKEGIKAF